MDHLLLPHEAARPRPRVPYVCNVPYDGADFLEYPARAGEIWHGILPMVDRPPFWLQELNNPIDDKQLESFLQCWIFFGLLHELLSPYGLYDGEDYLGSDKQGRYVHTRGLASMLQKWSEHARALDQHSQETTKLRLTSCIKLAYGALSCLRANMSEPTHGHPNFSRPIRTSILSICETISNVGDIVLDVLPEIDWLYFSGFATFNDDEKALMRQNGWCPSLIASEEKRFTSIALYVYLQHLRQPLEMDHGECSEEECKIIQIDTKTYSPRHTEDSCTCNAVGPQLNAVARCLDDATFPVLEVCGNNVDDVSLETLPYRHGVAYVALSHVWVDGLGNPAELTLPACQIIRLQTQVKSLEGQSFTWLENNEERKRVESRHLYLWCDSLVCPIQLRPDGELSKEELEAFNSNPDVQRSKQLKGAALSHMREVYTEAAYVLVLDRALERVRALDINPVEAAVHLITSRWMQRLWTYQEAALPTKLLIQFADTTLDFRDLLLQMLPITRENPVLRSMALVVFSRCRDLRSYQSLRAKGGPDLLGLNSAIRHRGVTFASDEPLCVGTILGVDLGQIAKVHTCEDRMATLWSLYCATPRGVPKNIIFNKFPRLSKPKFRWAPSTFRQRPTEGLRSLPDRGSCQRAELTTLGLSVRYRGFRIRLTAQAWGAVGSDWMSLRGDSDLLYVQHHDGTWFCMTKSQSPLIHQTAGQPLWSLIGQEPEADWHVIIDSDEIFGSREGREAILGVLEPHESGVSVFSSRILVALTLTEPRHVTILRGVEKHADVLRRDKAFFVYQVCFAVNALAALLVLQLPIWPRRFIFPVFRTPIYWFSRLPLLLFSRHLTRRGTIASQSEAVADAMIKINATNIAGFIALHFMGSIAVVTESYDAEHEWCVE
nr:hypothetical protein CFP56_73201 [Quercus suber]